MYLLKIECLRVLLKVGADTAVMDVGFTLLLELEIRECHQLLRKVCVEVSVNGRLLFSIPNAANLVGLLYNRELCVLPVQEGKGLSPCRQSGWSCTNNEDLHLTTGETRGTLAGH